MDNQKEKDLLDTLSHELRRGTIILCVLSQLKEAQYGYSLVLRLEEKGFKIEPGTLYPLLRRLEKQGLLESTWNTEGSKPRKYYQINELGTKVYEALHLHWKDIVKTMNMMMNEED